MRHRPFCLFAASVIAAGSLAAQGAGRIGGVLSPDVDRACVAPIERLRMSRELARYARNPGMLPAPSGAALYEFYPMAGVPGTDLMCSNYNDLDTSSGIREWRCGPITYNGHDASDALIRSFGEQDLGVPVFAAMDGRVTASVDGYFDRNIQWAGTGPANRVTIDHGGGRVCQYLHFRKNSVLVQRNATVRAGQQIAMTGSSGRSSWPHLHFSTRQGGVRVEPFAGACNQNSLWKSQPDFGHALRLWDFGVSRTSPGREPVVQEAWPGGGQVRLSDALVYIWAMPVFLPANSTVRYRFYRPNATLAFDSGTRQLGNTSWRKLAKFWASWNVTDMHTIKGTWRVDMDLNGNRVVSAPVEVIDNTAPFVNRPPRSVTATLSPQQPTASDAIFCNVSTTLVNDDDYDIVRYRYRWIVTGRVVRDITHAGEADAIPRGTAIGGDRVVCIVTPGDGKTNGASTQASVVITPSPWTKLGFAKRGTRGLPDLSGYGSLSAQHPAQWEVTNGRLSAPALLLLSSRRGDLPVLGGTLVPFPIEILVPLPLDADGTATLPLIWPRGIPPQTSVYAQSWILDPAATFGFAATGGLQGVAR